MLKLFQLYNENEDQTYLWFAKAIHVELQAFGLDSQMV